MSVAGVTISEAELQFPGEVVLQCASNGLPRPLAGCNNKQLGRYGESLARAYLESRGYEILQMNWRSTFGEVDIVAAYEDTVVLVEVKTRVAASPDTKLAPELAVNYRKQSKYQKLALLYLSLHARVQSVRFDVVAILLTGENDARLRHYASAYEWDE